MLSKQALRTLLRWRETVLSAICERTAVSDIGEVKRFQEIQKEEIDVLAEQEHQISLQKMQRDKSILRKQKKADRRQSRRLANFDSENVNDNVVRDRDLFSLQDVTTDLGEERFEAEDLSEDERMEDVHQIGDIAVDKRGDQTSYLDQIDDNMQQYYDNYVNARKRRENKLQQLQEIERAADGHADLQQAAEAWFKQQEFAETADDAEFASHFPLPREGLQKERDHVKRVKTLAKQAKELAKQQRSVDELREEHFSGVVQGEDQKDFSKQWKKLGVQDIQLVERERQDAEHSEEEEEFEADEEEFSEELPNDANSVLVSPARRQKSYGALLARQNVDATATKIGLATCLTNKKGRRELEESAYNRHTFYADEVNLPKWF